MEFLPIKEFSLISAGQNLVRRLTFSSKVVVEVAFWYGPLPFDNVF